MPYSDSELKNELLRCYKNEGEVTTEILNSSDNDYPTQMTYYNRFGSLREAKESVGLIAGHSKSRVLSDIEQCYKKYDEVSTEKLDSDDELVNYQVVYKHYGSLSDAVKDAGIQWESAKCEVTYGNTKYTEEELIQNLIDCKEENGNTKTTTVDNFDGPTSQAYKTKFGSLRRARTIAGIEQSFDHGKVEKMLQESNYEKKSDAVIYVLKINVNGEEAYYVGESTNIKKRLSSHIHRTKIQAWANGPYGKILAPRSKTGKMNEIKIKSIDYTIPLYKQSGESDIEFRRRRKYKEHHEHLSVAIENDTLDVYGGR